MDIIYITDNCLDDHIFKRCQDYLIDASNGKKIISISQKKIDFGDNFCIGEIGRSYLSIEKQILKGIEQSKSKWVAIAEHDVIYSKEHFNFKPPNSKRFWYNKNFYYLQYSTGEFARRNRKILSQLICSRKLLLMATKIKIKILSNKDWFKYSLGEPGVASYFRTICKAKNNELKRLVKSYVLNFSSEEFKTKTPNIDIRHGNNFSGGRTARRRFKHIKPWGKMKDIL